MVFEALKFIGINIQFSIIYFYFSIIFNNLMVRSVDVFFKPFKFRLINHRLLLIFEYYDL